MTATVGSNGSVGDPAWVNGGYAGFENDRASLMMYVGANVNISGNGVANDTGLAGNFNYYGLPTNTSVDFFSNANFCGAIYAPEAYFSLGGGGSTSYDFVGKAVAQTLKMNGHYNFHFDESLKVSQLASGYVASSWDEL